LWSKADLRERLHIKAANLVHVGRSKGRGQLAPAAKQSVPVKGMWLYLPARDFRAMLTQ